MKVTAVFEVPSGAYFCTEEFGPDSRLSEVLAWARDQETDGRSLKELICRVTPPPEPK